MKSERLLWALGGASMGIGLFALVQFLARKQRSSLPGAGVVTPAPEPGLGSSAPAESWRGSGLAEDVGVDRQPSEEAESEAMKQRMMREAARELGLPE